MTSHSKKTVLLTGATGNMGGATLRELMGRTDRFRVRALVLPSEREHPSLRQFRGHPDLEVVAGDLRSYDDVYRAVDRVDQILHIGGLVSPLADRFPELTMEINVGGARNIVNAVKAQVGADRVRLVYIGTVAQTGHRPAPIHWGRVGDPIKISSYDHYAVSKTQAEAIVAESGLKHWVSLRQTGIAHAGIWKIFDPIIFHNPFNDVLEWVTVGDSGRLAANTCEEGVPDALWRSFYNIGGGERMRVVSHEFTALMAGALGQADWRRSYQPNWIATRNFHGQWYTDSDRLEELVPFRRETLQDFAAQVASSAPLYVKLGARFASGLGRLRIKRLAESEGGPLHWLAHGDEAHIKAYFGSRAAWAALPKDWKDVVLAQPSRVPSSLDHGYDETKPLDALSTEELVLAAEFRGTALVQRQLLDAHVPADWRCPSGHTFQMSPNLLLKGGHWCPQCMVDPSTYPTIARRSPHFAQVWGREAG